MSARNRRSRTRRRLVDSPRRLPGSRSSWIAVAPVSGWSGPVRYTRGTWQPGRTPSYSARVGPTGASVGASAWPRWRRVHPLRGPGRARHRVRDRRLGGPARRAAVRLGAARSRSGWRSSCCSSRRRSAMPSARSRRPSTSRRTSRSSPRSGGTSPSRVFRSSSSAVPATSSRSWPTAATCRSVRTRWRRWAGSPSEGYSNSRLVDGVVFGPLTDLFAMPTWVPAANVF